jgi:cytochrome P450
MVCRPVDEIPLYREGASDEESVQRFQDDPIRFHLRAFRQLGPIYATYFRKRIWVVLAGLEANDFVWRNWKIWDYSEANAPFLDEMGTDHVTALDGEHHRDKRTILKPAFDQTAAMRFLPEFHRLLDDELSKASKQRIELTKFWAKVITKINSRTVARAEIPDEVIERMAEWEYQMLRGLFLDDGRASYIERERYQVLKAETFTWLRKIVDERLANPGLYEDNFAATLQARAAHEGGIPDSDRLVNDLYLILLAGTDNTSNLINSVLILLATYPEWLRAVREELDSWDGCDVRALAQMPRLKASILETQRVRPGTFALGKYAGEDFDFEGYRVPAGTDVLHVHTLGHFLEEVYEEPFLFKLERFLEHDKFVPKTFGLFGGGPHVCLGKNHSLMQTPIAVAQAIRNYDVAFEEPPEKHVRVGYAGSRLHEELWASLVPRR